MITVLYHAQIFLFFAYLVFVKFTYTIKCKMIVSADLGVYCSINRSSGQEQPKQQKSNVELVFFKHSDLWLFLRLT